MAKVIHYGRQYDAVEVLTDEAANSFMEKNPEYGVLTVINGKIYLAKTTDKGR